MLDQFQFHFGALFGLATAVLRDEVVTRHVHRLDQCVFVRPDAPELNDVEFSNVVDPDSGTSTAAPGVILTATFAVPMDYRGPQHVYLFAIPETFAIGFDVVPTQIGRGVALNIIVPGPAAAMPGLVLGAGVWCRRRRV